jgi:hypothetical protein
MLIFIFFFRQMMAKFRDKMGNVGIIGSEMSAKYQGVTVDMFRWQTYNDSNGIPMLKKWYPFVPKFNIGEAISDYFFPQDIPARVLFPLQNISLFGVYAKIPKRMLDMLKIRYPLTWFMTFPYKWKCWTVS